jgi:predicted MPP superfamily phosphohydrolase
MIEHTTIQFIFYAVFLLIAGYAAIRALIVCNHSLTHTPLKTFILMFVYYGLHLTLPYFSWILWQWSIGAQTAWEALPMLVICLFLIYSRFIEPVFMVVRHTPINLQHAPPLEQPLKVALIADIHIGLFSGRARQLRKIVELVNKENPDCIVISGDWTYEPSDHLLHDLSILSGFIAPAYSVPGNHDEQIPGPPVQAILREAIEHAGVIPIEDQIIEMDEVRIIGVGDLWAGKANLDALPQLPQDKHWLIVAHNPDTVSLVPPLPNRPLMLSGHTHGGQIELPWITDYVMKKVSLLGYKKGLYQAENAQVYVTIGTGLVGVPLRFRAAPTIDILHLH